MGLKIGCVLLASGEAARFGGNKLLHPFQGRPLLHWAARAVPDGLTRVGVTRWAEAAALLKAEGFAVVLHDFPDLCDSVRLGATQMQGMDGACFLVGDQPLLTRATVARAVAAFESDPQRIVRVAWGDRPGNPVVFPSALFPELMCLPPGRGGGAVVARHAHLVTCVQADSPLELSDVDTPETLKALECARIGQNGGICADLISPQSGGENAQRRRAEDFA